MFFIDTYKKTGQLHHAYVIEGPADASRAQLFHFIKNDLALPVRGNPDLWHGRFETLSIDDARMLRDRQATKSFSAPTSARGSGTSVHASEIGQKIFVIETRFMTAEAQNALLKIFEEPTAGTHFFIITPSAEIFLPTLLSRVVVVRQEHAEENAEENESVATKSGVAENKMAEKFLALSPSKRLAFVAEMIEEKEKGAAADFINELIKTIRLTGSPITSPKTSPALLAELLRCREYISDRSASLKLILEHVALIVPPSS